MPSIKGLTPIVVEHQRCSTDANGVLLLSGLTLASGFWYINSRSKQKRCSVFWQIRDRMARNRRIKRMQRGLCGCGGELSETGYCETHVRSLLFELSIDGEVYYRQLGWGRRVDVFAHAGDAMMAHHRQIFGAFEDVVEKQILGHA